MKVTVNATESFKLPDTPQDVTMKQFIDFDLHYQEILKWIAEIGPDRMLFKSNQVRYITKLAESISLFSGVKKENLFGLEVGDLGEHLMKLKKKDQLDIEVTKASIVKLHLHMCRIVLQYVPQIHFKEYEFTHKGEKWYLPNFSKGFHSSKIINPSIRFGDAVEALENDRVQEAKIEEKGYGDGSAEYTRLIKSVAIFARKKKLKKIKSMSQLSSKIVEQTHYFQDINMAVGLDCSFFLSDFSTI